MAVSKLWSVTNNLTKVINYAANPEKTAADNFTEEQRGQTHQTHSFFTFQPASGENLIIYLTATDKAGNVTRSREAIKSSPTWNHIIRYTGVLYTPKVSEDNFQIEIDKEWNTEIQNEDIGK